jgi:CubicO group peptidase (beta-lactamase class C family)
MKLQTIFFAALVLVMNAKRLFAQGHAGEIRTLMQEANLPAISFAYIKDGRIAEHFSLGVTSAESGVPINDSTVFSACSLGKSVFAYTIYQLMKAGLLDPDKPLYTYFSYKDVEADPRSRKVTARMILTHSSGLPNWRDDADLHFLYDPGQRFSYSGEGFVWLSKVAEKITGKPIEDLVRDKVFQPLGMRHTSYVWQAGLGQNFAYPHIDIGRSMSKDFPAHADVAQSMQTTALDYAKFMRAVLKDKKFLALLKTDKGMPVGPNVSWRNGLGFEETTSGPAFWQWGDNGTFKAFMIAYPDKQEGLVYFSNSFLGLRIARDLLGIYFNSNQPALDWLHLDSVKAPDLQVFLKSLSMPVNEALAPYCQPGRQAPDTSLLNEANMNYLGNRFTQLGHYDKAETFLKLNLLNYPASATAYRGLGEMYMRAGQPQKSAECWAKAYQLNQQYAYPKLLSERLIGAKEAPEPGKKTIHFRLEGYLGARFVAVGGSFNGWNDAIQPLHYINGGWEADVQLKPGNYNYKFNIDGVWLTDPKNPDYLPATLDSKLEVK